MAPVHRTGARGRHGAAQYRSVRPGRSGAGRGGTCLDRGPGRQVPPGGGPQVHRRPRRARLRTASATPAQRTPLGRGRRVLAGAGRGPGHRIPAGRGRPGRRPGAGHLLVPRVGAAAVGAHRRRRLRGGDRPLGRGHRGGRRSRRRRGPARGRRGAQHRRLHPYRDRPAERRGDPRPAPAGPRGLPHPCGRRPAERLRPGARPVDGQPAHPRRPGRPRPRGAVRRHRPDPYGRLVHQHLPGRADRRSRRGLGHHAQIRQGAAARRPGPRPGVRRAAPPRRAGRAPGAAGPGRTADQLQLPRPVRHRRGGRFAAAPRWRRGPAHRAPRGAAAAPAGRGQPRGVRSAVDDLVLLGRRARQGDRGGAGGTDRRGAAGDPAALRRPRRRGRHPVRLPAGRTRPGGPRPGGRRRPCRRGPLPADADAERHALPQHDRAGPAAVRGAGLLRPGRRDRSPAAGPGLAAGRRPYAGPAHQRAARRAGRAVAGRAPYGVSARRSPRLARPGAGRAAARRAGRAVRAGSGGGPGPVVRPADAGDPRGAARRRGAGAVDLPPPAAGRLERLPGAVRRVRVLRRAAARGRRRQRGGTGTAVPSAVPRPRGVARGAGHPGRRGVLARRAAGLRRSHRTALRPAARRHARQPLLRPGGSGADAGADRRAERAGQGAPADAQLPGAGRLGAAAGAAQRGAGHRVRRHRLRPPGRAGRVRDHPRHLHQHAAGARRHRRRRPAGVLAGRAPGRAGRVPCPRPPAAGPCAGHRRGAERQRPVREHRHLRELPDRRGGGQRPRAAAARPVRRGRDDQLPARRDGLPR